MSRQSVKMENGDLDSILRRTEVMQQVEKGFKEEPAQILRVICSEHEKTGQPVPDYRLHLSGYIGEVSLKALVASGLVKQESGGRVSIYTYSPTEAGQKIYQKHVKESRS